MFAYRFTPFLEIREEDREYVSHKTITSLHGKTSEIGETLTLDLPFFSLFLLLLAKKKRTWNQSFCHEFTNVECRDQLLEPFFREMDRQCSLFALIAHASP